jgi:rfaE bifunctional protein kinase chain/domain/rfaE bifunctional protein nucleotidyltransferase chain/domain
MSQITSKILDLKNLKIEIDKLKKKKIKIVHCHGVFDLLHIGHINYLQSAKKLGDVLIVSVTEDKFINKGPGRPFFTNNLRMQSLAALSCVDYIYLNNAPTALEAIRLIKPNYYVKGKDYKDFSKDLTSQISYEVRAAKRYGAKFITTNDNLFSSSKLINASLLNLSSNHKQILQKIKNQYLRFDNIKKKILELKNKKAVVIGEAIIDKYVFCQALGKASKDLNLNIKKIFSEKYLGGSLAIAKNLSSYCKKVEVLTFLGSYRDDLKFINSNLENSIYLNFLKKNNSPTILKTRYLDEVDKIKLLGVYDFNDQDLNAKEEKRFIRLINRKTKGNDYIILTDYNHGIITNKVAKNISLKNKFNYSINCQLNSSNMRYRALEKYKNPKLVIINENELRYEFRDRNTNSFILAKKLIKKLNSKCALITCGKRGMFFIDKKKIYYCDAFTDHAVDKIGAGDTVLAFFSIFFNSGFSIELSLLISSLAARHSVKDIANKNSYNKSLLLQDLHYLLK